MFFRKIYIGLTINKGQVIKKKKVVADSIQCATLHFLDISRFGASQSHMILKWI